MPYPTTDTGKPFTGLTARVSMGEKEICYISGCNLSLSKEIIEILAFGMEYKEKVPAIKDWSMSIDGTAAFAKGNNQEALITAFEAKTGAEFKLFLDEHTLFTGTGFVSSLEIEAAPDDKVNITCEVAGSGAVVATIPGGE